MVASNSHGVGRGNCLVDWALATGFWFRARRVDSSIPTVLIRYTSSTDITITASLSRAVSDSMTGETYQTTVPSHPFVEQNNIYKSHNNFANYISWPCE